MPSTSLSCHVLPVLAPPQRKQRANVGHILQSFEKGHQVQQVVVSRIVDPALYGYCVV